MKETNTAGSHIGAEIALAALAVGVAGDSLLRSVPWGLNFPIMAAVFASALVILRYRAGVRAFAPSEYVLLGAALFFASWFAIRDSEPLLFLNFLAIVLIGAVLFIPRLKVTAGSAGIVHLAASGIAMGLSAAFMPFVLLAKDLQGKTGGEGLRKALLVLRGVLIAAPLLFIFGALFASADARFEGLVTDVFDVVPGDLLLHGLFTAIFAWPAAGILRALTLGVTPGTIVPSSEETSEQSDFEAWQVPSITEKEAEEPKGEESAHPEPEEKPKRSWSWQDLNNSFLPGFLTVGPVEVGVVLGSLNLLFLLFVILQIPYLFGGIELVQTMPGLKLSDYARRGFGELFAASILTLPVLLALHWLVKRESARAVSLFRYLSATQIVLLFVIMASAFQRMLLLTGELGYGMTRGRFFPMVFMIWLAVIFLLFGYTVLRGKRESFAWSAAVSAFVMVAVLNFVNPDAFIAARNLELKREGRPFDARYHAELSADAVPVLLNGLAELDAEQKEVILTDLYRYECHDAVIDDLRVWNLSRMRLMNQVVPGQEDLTGCRAVLQDK